MISKSSLEAIQALVELAKLPKGKYEGAGSIARRINAPPNYLGKILQKLVLYGVVVSQKGLGGGFRLGKSPDKITIYEIVKCLEDMDRWTRCFMRRSQCPGASPCRVHSKWKAIREKNLNFLKDLTVSNI